MISTRNVAAAPIALITIDRCHPFAASASPLCFSFSQWRTMPVCDSVNDVNTPTTYSWISRLRSASNATINRLGERAQDDHAVREDEAVASVGELPRHEPVARQDRGEPREVLVGGVRGEHQDGRGEELHEVEEEPPAEHGVRDLPDDRSLLADR